MRFSRCWMPPALVLLALLVASSLSACSSSGGTEAGSKAGAAIGGSGGGAASDGGAAGSTQLAGAPDPLAEIPAEGPHETAAAAALPGLVGQAQKQTKDAGMKVADLTNAKARLVAYQIYARVGDRGVLFEVRADGKAHELYKYPAEPDPAKLFWQDAAYSEGMYTAEPEGDAEKAAAAAVRAVIEKAAPGQASTVLMSGYTFYWVDANGDPVTDEDSGSVNITITPKGTLGSWSV